MLRQLILGLTAMAVCTGTAQAKPAYARKEKKECGFCHTNPAGGGARNARGMYYETHNLSFAGFTEPGAPRKTGPAAFISSWKLDLPDNIVRATAAEVSAEGAPRIITLGSDHVLAVHKLAAEGPVKEADVQIGDAGTFVAGRFAKKGPAVIAAKGAVYLFKDGKLVKKEAAVTNISGTVRFADGSISFWYYDGQAQPESYGVDPDAANPLTAGSELVPPDQAPGVYREIFGHLSSEILANLMFPEAMRKTGLFGLLDARSDNKICLITPVEKEGAWHITAIDPSMGPDSKPIWSSPRLAGRVLDMTYGPDAKGSKKTGLYILTENAGKKQLEFFALD